MVCITVWLICVLCMCSYTMCMHVCIYMCVCVHPCVYYECTCVFYKCINRTYVHAHVFLFQQDYLLVDHRYPFALPGVNVRI